MTKYALLITLTASFQLWAGEGERIEIDFGGETRNQIIFAQEVVAKTQVWSLAYVVSPGDQTKRIINSESMRRLLGDLELHLPKPQSAAEAAQPCAGRVRVTHTKNSQTSHRFFCFDSQPSEISQGFGRWIRNIQALVL